jgi:hydroxypyruvate reductase
MNHDPKLYGRDNLNREANMDTKRAADDAMAIWHAGVAAVSSEQLIKRQFLVRDGRISCQEASLNLKNIGRILVVGAGKAGAGMAAGMETALGGAILEDKHVTGWVNVPDNCVRALRRIHLHAARPAARNEPTSAGVAGAQRIYELVHNANANDLVICLLSGGGSALLPLPAAGITWQDKLDVTRFLSAAGADIRQLNTVRKQLSGIKGGGLARACRAGHLLTLIISDVIGDPLDVIASGPTVANPTTAQDAIEVLQSFSDQRDQIPQSVSQHLRRQAELSAEPTTGHGNASMPTSCVINNIVLGNNDTAVEAAAGEAAKRGYQVVCLETQQDEGTAEEVGRRLLDVAQQLNPMSPTCILSGGEPTVRLVDEDRRGRGGRNQQVVLAVVAAAFHQAKEAATPADPWWQRITLLSGGTDGEDGPTDAAGAIMTDAVVRAALRQELDPLPYLERNDAYSFFQRLDALLITGPTHTNVCDVRVVIVEPAKS